MKISLKNVSREDWLKLRKTGIGGSDAGAICGVNNHRSAGDVYLDKISDEIEKIDNEAMRQGRDLEDYCVQRFMEATGLKVKRSNFFYRSEEYPFMLANVDRVIIGENAGLECKTCSAYSADQWKDGAIPESYQIQCQHYMSVMGWAYMYIACVILGKGFVYQKLNRDDRLIEGLIAIEQNFWNEHVQKRMMPRPDGSKAYDNILNQLYPAGKKESTIPLLGFDFDLRRREELSGLIEKMEMERNEIEQKIKQFMQDNETAESSQYKVSWKNVETARLDTKRFKAEEPTLYEKYLRHIFTRRFTVKEQPVLGLPKSIPSAA